MLYCPIRRWRYRDIGRDGGRSEGRINSTGSVNNAGWVECMGQDKYLPSSTTASSLPVNAMLNCLPNSIRSSNRRCGVSLSASSLSQLVSAPHLISTSISSFIYSI